jgi:hypothetical protein
MRLDHWLQPSANTIRVPKNSVTPMHWAPSRPGRIDGAAGADCRFPSLRRPTAEIAVPARVPDDRCRERAAMMPTRRRTRAQNRAHRIEAERRQNRNAREARHDQWVTTYFGPAPNFGPAPPGDADDEPPPF